MGPKPENHARARGISHTLSDILLTHADKEILIWFTERYFISESRVFARADKLLSNFRPTTTENKSILSAFQFVYVFDVSEEPLKFVFSVTFLPL